MHLGGQVAAREPLRYSPGWRSDRRPASSHTSPGRGEGGAPRQVELEIEVVAIGEVAIRLDTVLPGQRLKATGFLAKRSRRSRRVVLHVNEFEID